ncbi:hypothetical protein LMK08_16575 [Metapseudomonas furukawaii]|uniref:hypothetical protein n=1 Tax=Metapseudomonas furukawaii TaxID=1149133 RepID=UPI00227BC891|nr:hypothetical protein [Pseudomonas furukawaii]WAG76990.1 hypothetical protein LMK08_16575 [Pseudomonas furukawaii]
MSDRNLDAYYYSFDPTGCDLVDAVLEQVARAGKAFHCTSDWNEDDFDGQSPVAKTQAAANASAQSILALIAENDRLRQSENETIVASFAVVSANKRLLEQRDQLRAEAEACAAVLTGSYYMDPPDGGDVSIPEQLRRMAKDAERYRHYRMGFIDPEKVDRDIDAAMSKGGQGNG